MSIQRSDLEKVAALARLRLGSDEVARLTRNCQAILDYFEAIRGAGVSGVHPAGTLDHATPLREDRVDVEPLLRPLEAMAPEWREGYFTLPRLPAMDGGESDDDEQT